MKYFQKKWDTAKRMVGYSDIKGNSQFIKETAKELWEIKGTQSQAKAASIDSLQLSDKNIHAASSTWKKMLVLFLVFAGLTLLYGIYNLILGNYMTSVVCAAVLLLWLAQSFRYHFWLFQLKKGKLGCSFKEYSEEAFKK